MPLAVTTLETLGDVFTQLINWFISFVGLISGEPILLIGLAIMVVGACIGLAFRAIHGS